MSGSQSGSGVVSGLPSVPASGIAVTGDEVGDAIATYVNANSMKRLRAKE